MKITCTQPGLHKNAIRILAATLLLAAGCATNPTKNDLPKYSFYPEAPDEPRIQFLTSFESSKDFPGSSNGKFMEYLTGKNDGLMVIGKPYGGVAGKGLIYVCDTASGAVMRLNLKDKKMDAIIGAGNVNFIQPVNMAVDEDGGLFIVDMGLSQLLVVDKDQNLTAAIGGKDMMKPMDVAISHDRIYLSDVKSHSVHVLDKATRKPLFEIPNAEDSQNITNKLFQPINIALDAQGQLYVSDFGASRIQIYDSTGKYLRSIGGRGDNYGEFIRTKGVAVDRENRVYVVDAAGQMVQMFDNAGRLLMWFGASSRKQVSLFLPAKVLVDYDDVTLFNKFVAPNFAVEHLIIVMNQYGPMKVAVFGFGHKK